MARHGENIRKRKDGRWEGRYKVFDEKKNRYIYRSVYSRTYEEAKEKLFEAKFDTIHQSSQEIPFPKNHVRRKFDGENGSPILFSRAAKEWFDEIAEKRKYSTYIKYSMVYKTHIVEVLGTCQLSSSALPMLQEKIFDHLSQKTLSESLQKSIFCIANQILDFANRKYSIGVSMLERPSVKTRKKNTLVFSKTEQAKLLATFCEDTDKFSIAALLCLYTGLRLGELCALRWTDIDFSDMTLSVNRTVQRVSSQEYKSKTILLETDPKSESSRRMIPLTNDIMNILTKLNGRQTYVFGKEKPMDPRTMQYGFKRILKAAEIDDRNFHLLRHTFATNCIENGMDVKALSEILGHSDVKITLNRYVHPTMDSKRKQIGMLPDFYGHICGQTFC